jgi:hypothetical protein
MRELDEVDIVPNSRPIIERLCEPEGTRLPGMGCVKECELYLKCSDKIPDCKPTETAEEFNTRNPNLPNDLQLALVSEIH